MASSAESFPIRRALISVSDKLGLTDFASGLQAKGVEIYSTGGTRAHLQACGIPVLDVAEYTGFPEMMGGRLKTLHPKVFGGILGRRDRPDDLAAMEAHQILGFDLVVVNLYPFQETVARSGVTREEAIEQIDIGGPSLIRAAAKNHAFVTVATRPEQYSAILEEVDQHGGTSLALRRRLAAECFVATSAYDNAIAEFFASDAGQGLFPEEKNLHLIHKSALRYGENPHQRAALYRISHSQAASLLTARQLHGKELSYNNYLDLDSALSIARSFVRPAAVIIKHNNPCGAAWAHKLSFACRKAFSGDPVSAFGGVIGFNTTVDVDTAEVLCEPGLFIEAIVAPDYETSALEMLKTKPKWRENVRLMQIGKLEPVVRSLEYRFLNGGVLVQEADSLPASQLQWKTVTEATVADSLWEDLAFGWEMVRHVKSNAIVLAHDAALAGVGAGQMSRVDSVEIAIQKAGERAAGSILASDAFFPFPDSIEIAAKAGVVAIIQPGGSRKDTEVIAACDEFRIPMVFTGRRHFKH
jgi:phosphoribosylaminoimidazolecarboxamide formyltransferase / IMP cyclohydrolase